MRTIPPVVRLYLGWATSSLLGLALLWWLLIPVDWPLVWAQGQSVSVGAWCVGVGGLMVSHVLRAGRIRNEWLHRLQMRWHEAWGLLVTHSAWVVLVPMRAGEAVYVWALHQRGQIGVREATLSLVKMRLQDVGILVCFAVFFWMPVSLVWRCLSALFLLLVVLPWIFPLIWRIVRQRLDQRASLEVEPSSLSNLSLHHAKQDRVQTGYLTLVQVNWASWFYAISNWAVKLLAIAWPLVELSGLDMHLALAAALGGEWGAAMPLQPPAGFGPYEAGAWAGAVWAQHANSESPAWSAVSPLPLNLAAAILVVHLMALAVTVTSAFVARLLGWSQRPFSGSIQP